MVRGFVSRASMLFTFLVSTAAMPVSVRADEAFCKPLHAIVLAAEHDFGSLGAKLKIGDDRSAPGNIVLPGMDRCEISASTTTISYVCEKEFASQAAAKEALAAVDARIRACRSNAAAKRVPSFGVRGADDVEYRELYPPLETYLEMYLGIWEEQGKYYLMLETGLDK